MFRSAIEMMNNQEQERNIKLDGQVFEIPYGNEFIASKKLCRFLKVTLLQISMIDFTYKDLDGSGWCIWSYLAIVSTALFKYL